VPRVPTFRQILPKSVEWYLRNPANYQTNKQTNADENITSLTQIIYLFIFIYLI